MTKTVIRVFLLGWLWLTIKLIFAGVVGTAIMILVTERTLDFHHRSFGMVFLLYFVPGSLAAFFVRLGILLEGK